MKLVLVRAAEADCGPAFGRLLIQIVMPPMIAAFVQGSCHLDSTSRMNEVTADDACC